MFPCTYFHGLYLAKKCPSNSDVPCQDPEGDVCYGFLHFSLFELYILFFLFYSLFSDVLKDLIHCSAFSFHFHASISNLYPSLHLSYWISKYFNTRHLPHCCFACIIIVTCSKLNSISPHTGSLSVSVQVQSEQQKLGDIYCVRPIWTCYRELLLHNCGSLLSTFCMAVVSESNTGAWSSRGRQLGKKDVMWRGEIPGRLEPKSMIWSPMSKNWNSF